MTDTSYARISAMLRGRRDVRTMPLPGIDEEVTIGIRILLDYEVDECRTASIKHIEAEAKKIGMRGVQLLDIDGELLDREITRQMIFKAIVKPDADENGNHKPFFPGPTAVRQLDTVIIQTLFEAYLAHQDFINPLRSADVEELAELADALGKGRTAEVILSQYDAPTLRTLVHSLASELQTLLGPKQTTSLQDAQT